ncbi:10985_t:CDS:1, partial [Scutellospora calospora]
QVTITISQDFALAKIEIYYYLHPTCLDNSISLEIKQYILKNIDLFPREIYKHL